MMRIFSVAAALAVGVTVFTAVHAQTDHVKQRQQAMKAMAGAAKEPGAVIKGEAKFDLDKIHQSLAVYQEKASDLKDLWPKGSNNGETAALPAIWEKQDEFLARFDKLATDAKSAASSIKDEASFKAEWPKVMSNCGGCHKEYRKPN